MEEKLPADRPRQEGRWQRVLPARFAAARSLHRAIIAGQGCALAPASHRIDDKRLIRNQSMHDEEDRIAVPAIHVPVRTKPSNYPEPFASRMAGRVKRQLGDFFGLRDFGVNLVVLAPGSVSALRHAHTRQDEFIYVLEGTPVLHTDSGRTQLAPGMCAGFPSATGNGHRLLNESNADAVYLEVGDRSAGDEATYPDDDLQACLIGGAWRFQHKDGTPY
jgi:uncharacterized cupin superfamily protein